jgi:hypothetical protein
VQCATVLAQCPWHALRGSVSTAAGGGADRRTLAVNADDGEIIARLRRRVRTTYLTARPAGSRGYIPGAQATRAISQAA